MSGENSVFVPTQLWDALGPFRKSRENGEHGQQCAGETLDHFIGVMKEVTEVSEEVIGVGREGHERLSHGNVPFSNIDDIFKSTLRHVS